MARTATKNGFNVTFSVRDMRAPDAPPAAKTVRVEAAHAAMAFEEVYRTHTGAGYVVTCPISIADAPAETAAPAKGKK